MSSAPATCQPEETCADAAKLMWDRDLGVVPIVDPAGKAVGVITDRDICMATYLQGRLPHQIRLGDVMSKPVYTCKAEDTLEEAVATMQRYRVRRLPVTDGAGQVVGLLSLGDVTRLAADKKLGKEADSKMCSQAFASICQPRIKQAQPAAS